MAARTSTRCRPISGRRWVLMLEEETQHLPRGVGASRIGERAGGAAARPGMTAAVNDPLLEDLPPARVAVERAAVGEPARRMANFDARLQVGCRRHRLCDDVIAVARVHRRVA